MVIALIGESCTGKSTLANALKEQLGAEVYSGKDYLRLAKSEAEAKQKFQALLSAHMEPNTATLIYVISEKEHIALLPEGALRVLVTAELPVIQEKKHGMFDAEPHDILIKSGEMSTDAACAAIVERMK